MRVARGASADELVQAVGMGTVTSADPASLAETARTLRRLADHLQECAGLAQRAASGPGDAGLPRAARAELRHLADACAATASATRSGGAALHRAAYAAADHAHARSAFADDARAAGLAVEDAPHESAPRLTLAPGVAGVADAEEVAARAAVLVRFTERRRALADAHRSAQDGVGAQLTELTAALARVAEILR